jgi:hypothetical protein
VRIDDLAAELSSLGREKFHARYGIYYLVFAEAELLDDAADFVNTASREAHEIAGARRAELDVRPLPLGIRKGTGRITVGRDKKCDVAIQHARVSSLHAVFSLGGGLLLIADAASKNGTRLNGVKLKANQPTPIDAGDTVLFGPVSATLWGLDDVIAATRRV